MADVIVLANQVQELLPDIAIETIIANGQLTLEVDKDHLRDLCIILKDNPSFHCELLIDICGVDYLDYGIDQWQTHETTEFGFSRGVVQGESHRVIPWTKPRFAVVYQLLSLKHNHRIRIRTFTEGEPPIVPSVIDIWNSANWFEREAFDLYGILFDGHPDLRRILTDYGFVGHPFRKDFPLIGNVEVRYDAAEDRVIYEPVSIRPRTLVPKVIRLDNRYEASKHPTTEGQT